MNLRMHLAAIDWTVVDELRHIPAGGPESPQEQLRFEYATFRTLHRRMTDRLKPFDALVQAIVNVQREYPNFAPRYDGTFFFGGAAMATTLREDELAREIHRIAAAGGGDSYSREQAVCRERHAAS